MERKSNLLAKLAPVLVGVSLASPYALAQDSPKKSDVYSYEECVRDVHDAWEGYEERLDEMEEGETRPEIIALNKDIRELYNISYKTSLSICDALKPKGE